MGARWVSFVVATLVFSSASGASLWQDEAYVPRLPIKIDGNADFTPANGVTSGTGSAEDPFVIEGWMIAGGFSAIALSGTSAHVLIRNNILSASFFFDEVQYAAAIRIIDASNVTIEGNHLSASQFGVHVKNGAHLAIRGNAISGIQLPAPLLVISNGGIHLWNAHDVQVTANSISGFGWGVTAHGDVDEGATAPGESRDLVIADNKLRDIVLSGGINLYQGVKDAVVRDNRIIDSAAGVILIAASNVQVENNDIERVGTGLDVFGSSGIDAEKITVDRNRVQDAHMLLFVAECIECRFTANTLAAGTEALYLFSGVEFTGNVVCRSETVFPWAPSEGAQIRQNHFAPDNEVYATINSGVLDVRENWWGSAEGPDPARFETTGDGSVQYEPWLLQGPTGTEDGCA